MSIFDRLSRLIRANVNDLIDQAENPEKMLNQILREMRTNIQTARAQLVEMVVQEKEFGGEVEQTRRLAGAWERKARAAVAAGKDDLAREALRRKRDNEQNARLYEQQHQVQVQAVTKLRGQLQLLEAKYQATRSQRDVLIARQRRADASLKVAASLSTASPLDPSAELDRMERKIRSREAQAAARIEMADDSFEARFRAFEDPEIEKELLALKLGPAAASSSVDGTDSSAKSEFAELSDVDMERELLALKSDR